MDLEGIMLSEMSGRERYTANMVSLICEILKNKKTQTQRLKRPYHREGVGGMSKKGKENIGNNIVISLHGNRWFKYTNYT